MGLDREAIYAMDVLQAFHTAAFRESLLKAAQTMIDNGDGPSPLCIPELLRSYEETTIAPGTKLIDLEAILDNLGEQQAIPATSSSLAATSAYFSLRNHLGQDSLDTK